MNARLLAAWLAAWLVAGLLASGCNSSRSPGHLTARTAPAVTQATTPAPVASATAVGPTAGTVSSAVVVTPPPQPVAAFLSVTSFEFAGGFGTPPPNPVPPPPPTISFDATFENTGPVDILASDPTLAVEVRYADAATPTQVAVKVVKLSQSLPRGMKGVETIDVGAIPSLLDPVSVSCAIVKVDPATGNVQGYVSPQTAPVTINPSIAYPP